MDQKYDGAAVSSRETIQGFGAAPEYSKMVPRGVAETRTKLGPGPKNRRRVENVSVEQSTPVSPSKKYSSGTDKGTGGLSRRSSKISSGFGRATTSSCQAMSSSSDDDCSDNDGDCYDDEDDCSITRRCDRPQQQNVQHLMLAIPMIPEPGPPTPSDQGIFLPKNVRYVSQQWFAPGVGGVPTPTPIIPGGYYFTTISSAIASIAALGTPLAIDAYSIVVYPGTYVESVALVSNVSLVGLDDQSCIIQGDVTYSFGMGNNAGAVALDEVTLIKNMTIVGDITILVIPTKSPALAAHLLFEHSSILDQSITYTGRPVVGANDLLRMKDATIETGQEMNTRDGRIEIDDSEIVVSKLVMLASAEGRGSFRMRGGSLAASGSISESIYITISSSDFSNAFITGEIALDQYVTNVIIIRSCAFDQFADLHVAFGKAYVQSSSMGPAAVVTSSGGTVDRELGVYEFGGPFTNPAVIQIYPRYVNPTQVMVTVQAISAIPNFATPTSSTVSAANTISIISQSPADIISYVVTLVQPPTI